MVRKVFCKVMGIVNEVWGKFAQVVRVQRRVRLAANGEGVFHNKSLRNVTGPHDSPPL